MAFIKKTWLARIGTGLNRFRMNNSTDVVLESNPVSVTQQGDQLSADNMNNLETRIDNAFTEMAGNLATIEVSPSQHNWTVGSQIVYNGILYKVTSAISTDDNLVVGTNISPYPVSSAISDINTQLHYSSAEEVCGTWVNGSPMYRRAYLETNTSIPVNTNLKLSTSLNSSAIIPISIDILIWSANAWRTLANDASAVVARGIVNDNGFYLANNFGDTLTKYCVIITYIKI